MKRKCGCIILFLLLLLSVVQTANAVTCESYECSWSNDIYFSITIDKSARTFTGFYGPYWSWMWGICYSWVKYDTYGTIDFKSKTGVVYGSNGGSETFTISGLTESSFFMNGTDWTTELHCSSPPSCPELFSWNGEEYQFSGSLYTRTHSPESEFLQEQMIVAPVVPQGETLSFLIKEIDLEESYVNSVAMFYRYVWDTSDEWYSLPFLSAVHSRDGNVMEPLLQKDDKRVFMIPDDEITLQYAVPPAGLAGIEFSVVASGYYLWSHTTWCEVLALGRQLNVTPGETVTLRAYINNMSTEILPDNAVVWFVLEDGLDTKVGSVSAAGLAPGSSQWYSLEKTVPDNLTVGTYTYKALVFLGDSDITWKPEYYPTLPDEPPAESAKGAMCN